jgi:hypothetical protein
MLELSAICLLLVAFVGGLAGPLLWPTLVHHAAVAVVLAHAAIAPFIETHQSAARTTPKLAKNAADIKSLRC